MYLCLLFSLFIFIIVYFKPLIHAWFMFIVYLLKWVKLAEIVFNGKFVNVADSSKRDFHHGIFVDGASVQWHSDHNYPGTLQRHEAEMPTNQPTRSGL
jgi:hypothetical protein